jgi:MFS family permease
MGAGVSAACNISTPYVVANWFGARRSTALAVAFVGLAVGPMSMTILANHLLSTFGWRYGYMVLAIPMLLVVVPLQISFISSRPPWKQEEPSPEAFESSQTGTAVAAPRPAVEREREASASASIKYSVSLTPLLAAGSRQLRLAGDRRAPSMVLGPLVGGACSTQPAAIPLPLPCSSCR